MGKYKELFDCFLDVFPEIEKIIEVQSLKCGLSANEGLVLISINRLNSISKYINIKIINSLITKGMIVNNNGIQLTSKGAIVAKSVKAALDK